MLSVLFAKDHARNNIIDKLIIFKIEILFMFFKKNKYL